MPDPSPTVVVRRARPDDRTDMARVHVETWKSTYRGLGFDDRLARLTVEGDLAAGFGSWLAAPPPGVAQFVAGTSDGMVVGFAMGCPLRDPDPDYTGELGAIYVLPTYQNRRVGTTLVRAVVDHLLGLGHASMLVWVLEGNPYRRFYERLGGTRVRERRSFSRIAGIELPEVGYGWSDLRSLERKLREA